MLRDQTRIFSTEITPAQNKDTGMAMVLILLLIAFFTGNPVFYKLAIPVLILDMTVPRVFYPIAVLWFGLSTLLGTVMSKVILSLVFAIIVVPVAQLRKLMGKDPMAMQAFGKGSESVLKIRDYQFTPEDIERPY